MLAALGELHDAHAADLRTWLPDDFDPEFVDLVRINSLLSKVPKRRPAATDFAAKCWSKLACFLELPSPL